MAHLSHNLLLIGLRGSGKSTIGRELAEQMHRPFVDLDHETAAYLNASSVAEAWKQHGESGFRLAEVRALRRVLANRGQIVALGGGTPTASGATDLIEDAQEARRAFVVYLRANSRTLRERLSQADNSDRPSLTGDDVIVEVDRVLAMRDRPYKDLADEVIDVDGLSVRSVVRAVADFLRLS